MKGGQVGEGRVLVDGDAVNCLEMLVQVRGA